MKALILSATAGQGHNSCANAIREAFEAHGDLCVVEDVFALISKKLAHSIAKNHEKTYRHKPKQSDASYQFLVRHPELFAKEKLIYQVMSIGRRQISRCIREGGYDTVVCTHALAGMILTAAMRREKLPVKTAFVATDYACSPGVNGTELDRYFIPHKRLIPEFVNAEVPESVICISGIPVQSAFRPASDKAELKQRLGLRPDLSHLLVMCGSMGCGPIPELLRMITAQMPENWEITVVCGTNAELHSQLENTHGSQENIHILGYAKEMSTLLSSADLYLTKPGGLSTAEAAAVGLPMVFIDAVAGCEENNLRHFAELGAAVAGKTASEASALCLELMQNPQRLQTMETVLSSLPSACAADRIWQEMQSLHQLPKRL